HERQVALKVILPVTSGDSGADRFDREIRVTAALQHPNILPVFDSGRTAGRSWYTMPYVAGETLRRRLQREGALPPAEAIRLAREVADALAYAHALGAVHLRRASSCLGGSRRFAGGAPGGHRVA